MTPATRLRFTSFLFDWFLRCDIAIRASYLSQVFYVVLFQGDAEELGQIFQTKNTVTTLWKRQVVSTRGPDETFLFALSQASGGKCHGMTRGSEEIHTNCEFRAQPP